MRASSITRYFSWAGLLAGVACGACGWASDGGAEAREVLAISGVKGGVVVHLGCGDGRLTGALGENAGYTVQGLDRDAGKVDAARSHIRGLGLYGPVSVERLAGTVLPYCESLINLAVVEDLALVPDAEVMRVLAPGGVMCRREGGAWKRSVKPWPDGIDEWSHFLHDSGNNAVARDREVGPARSLRWIADPKWLRSHETPSGFEALVTAAGRIFYFFDEGLVGITDQRLPERWSLVCRDAFNGRFLWKRPLGAWGWTEWAAGTFGGKDWTTVTGGRTVVPEQNHRRLVADGDRLYATLSFDAPLSILDAATGETRVTVEGTAPVREVVASGGTAVIFSTDADEAQDKGRKRKGKAEKGGAPGSISAIEGQSGTVLWRASAVGVRALSLAVDGGRVIYMAGPKLVALDLKTGAEVWSEPLAEKLPKTLVAHSGCVVISGASGIEVHDGATGAVLWHKRVPMAHGPEGQDLFVVDGVVWPGLLSVDADLKPTAKAADVLAIGYDLRTGQERKRIHVKEIRSPEHHHRCYRNKATERYVITSMEGAEFVDLVGDGHSQDNFLRGACKYGMMPANGLLYAPPDQCFCQPGAKLLGLTATATAPHAAPKPLSDDLRVEKGPAFGKVEHRSPASGDGDDWPTFRHDPARHASTVAAVGAKVTPVWTAKLGGPLTAPVAAGGRVYVGAKDGHAVHALDAATGKAMWAFTAGGRVDSPPTVFRGMVIFGSADGRVYCLRASDGAMVWRFLAAPVDRRIICRDQIESAWPVHGSVLVKEASGGGVVYFAAGRSSYLDGGIRLYGLDAATGQVLHRAVVEGPFPLRPDQRDVAFYVLGANSDVLVAEGDAIFMRQKRFTPALAEVKGDVLSTKGEMDVGMHLFSTSGLLDDSWYNRAFWLYSKRWPGFQLANQAPKAGQLLVVDGENTYGVNPFYRRNVHSPMFFPGKEGYLLFADKNTNEPQIVGEEGARKPVEWLPQSDYVRRDGLQKLDTPAFGLDKMMGYTRAEPPVWTRWLKVRVRAMVKAGDVLFAIGPPDELDAKDPLAAFEGKRGARLVSISARDGAVLAERDLATTPVFDGLIAAGGALFVSLEDGTLACLK